MSQTKSLKAQTKFEPEVIQVGIVVVLGAIMSILDTTVVSVALKDFESIFHTDKTGAAWTMTGYTLALAAVIPLSGWAAGKFGTRRVYLASIVLFTFGSLLCAFSSNIEQLVAFRVIQGLGGGLLMPVGMMMLTKAAGPERVGSVMAVIGIPMMLGPILGPILGGFLMDTLSWEWLFLINLPISIIAFVFAYKVLSEGKAEKANTALDVIGLLLLSPGLALLLYGLSSSAAAGSFTDSKVVIPAGIGALLVVIFVAHSLRHHNPLVDLRLFKNFNLSIAILTVFIFILAFFGSSILYAQYFIGIRLESTLIAGLLLAPQGIGSLLTMPIAGILTDKIGPGKMVVPGIILAALGLAAFAFLDAETSYYYICGALFIQGLGIGMTMMPTMSAALITLKPEMVNHGSTLLSVVQQVAASIGTAMFAVILTNKITAAPTEMTAGYAATFAIAAIILACAVVPALFLPRKKLEKTADDAPVFH